MATNKPAISLRQRALNLLARREYSRQELQHKLAPYADEAGDGTGTEAITALLEDFQKRGWLSDERFSEQIVHARKGRYGSLKVAHELREKGVSETTADKAVAAMAQEDLANARLVWQKKFGAQPQTREEWAKQARFLQSRGFGFDTIHKVLRGEQED